jgi:catalase-peroxidase
MAMNDEETVALIAGGHTFGKAHGAHDPAKCVGPEPAGGRARGAGPRLEEQVRQRQGRDTVTSGLEGAWTANPIEVDNAVPRQPVRLRVGADQEPRRARPSGAAKGHAARSTVPDAHDPSKRHAPIMFTTDLALKFDPAYEKISSASREPEEFAGLRQGLVQADAPRHGSARALPRPEVPAEALIWQDPVPAVDHPLIDAHDIAALKAKILASGPVDPQLVRTAWASAATFRGTDMRGGANGARIRLAPQKDWAVNDPAELAKVLARSRHPEGLQRAQSPAARRCRWPT